MIALNQILVATDFSEPSNVAFTYGRELARRFGATLHVLHVMEDYGSRFAEVPLYAIDLGRMQTDAERTARERLYSLLSEEDRQALHAKTVVLTSNTPRRRSSVTPGMRCRRSVASSWARTGAGGSRGSGWGASRSGSSGRRRVRSSPSGIPSMSS